ncbi:protein LLP homolog [Phlebotomus argentipes]|uniref:protein LLP homolog n=1 Tax=Phlebotomus argentipes TaxID=94469 RepID=UPI002893152B|nr:protein LLP homolog [Phlebotomus argentipes]
MGRKKRAQNNNVKRERFAVKELARLKKCLGLIDEKGNEISKEVKKIATVTDAKAIKQKAEERMLVDGEEASSSKKKLKTVKVVNEKTEVEHVYNAKTMKDQFGNYPVWYKRRNEKRKKKLKGKDDGGKSRKNRRRNLFTVTDPYKNLEYE